MKNRRMRTSCPRSLSSSVALCLLAVPFFPSTGSAQADPDSVRHRNDCRLAEQIVRTGEPSPKKAWAASQIGFCEDARGTVIPDMIRELAHTAGAEDPRFGIYSKGRFLHDGRIFEALLDVAGDRAAQEHARVYAFETLSSIHSPVPRPSHGFRSGLDPASGLPSRSCSMHPAGGRPVAFQEGEVPLPADVKERISELARRVYEDETESDVVRGAAYCTG